MFRNVFYVLVYLLPYFQIACFEDVCFADRSSTFCESSLNMARQLVKRYILYEVNPGEGFNLRRDVYMRIAILVKKLNEESESEEWILVLPPWGPLYHWKSKTLDFQAQIKWSKFFDIPSLAKYVPVIEFEDFLIEYGPVIDTVMYLQHYAEGWSDEHWEEKADVRDCNEPPAYSTAGSNKYLGWFWGYENVSARDFFCLSIQGYTSTLKKLILSYSANLRNRAVMIDRAEIILHDSFGSAEYWKVRKSMVFSKQLVKIGDSFRKMYLNSTDEMDRIEKSNNLTHTKRSAVGGPYIGVHLRRRDFVQSRSKDVPSLKHAADQISKQMKKLNLQMVFVATDASKSEFEKFQQYIPTSVRFVPDLEVHKEILDGGVAIVDQWICAHARYFIGTHESTFSFRIQEEREILGFPIEMTFNRLCGNNQTTCKHPSKWTIVHS